MDDKHIPSPSDDNKYDSVDARHGEEASALTSNTSITSSNARQQQDIQDSIQIPLQSNYLVNTDIGWASAEHLVGELEHLRQRYNAVLKTMVSHFVELDQDWCIQALSQSIIDSLGKPVQALMGQACEDVFAHDYPSFEPYFVEAVTSGKAVTFEVLSREFVGSWLSVCVYPHKSGLLLHALDISVQRKAEKAFKESRGRLELLRQQSPLGIVEWDNDFRILACNPAAEAIFGFTEDDILGEPTTILVPADQREQVSGVLEKALSKKAVVHNINTNLTKDGKIITCEWYNVPLTTLDGRVVGVTGLVQDVSKAQQAADKLTRLAEFRRKLIDISRDIFQRDLGHDLYQHILQQAIVSIPHAQAGSIILATGEDDYRFVAAEGYDLNLLQSWPLREQDLVTSPKGSASQIHRGDFESKFKSLTADKHELLNKAGRIKDIHTSLAVPVSIGNDRKGLLFIDNFEDDHAFTDDALEMAEIFAGQIGVYLRRLQLETELREREVRSRALLEALPDTISRHDAHGRYLDVRPGVSFASHYSPTELLGKPLQELMDGHNQDAIQTFQEAHDKARQTRRIQHAEYSFMFQGERQYREVRVVATEALTSTASSEIEQASSRAEPIETIAIVRDISPQKAAEQAVLESETRYRIISDVMTDVLYAYKRNEQGGFSRNWSSGLGEVKLTGYKIPEIDALGGWPSIVHPDDTAKVNYLSHPSRRERVVVEYRIITKGGSIKWIRDFSRAVFDSSGAIIVALYGANQDITEQKLAERALESAKGELERALAENTAILESITDSFVSVTDSWQLSYINKRALSYTAFDNAEQALGAPYFQVFPFVKEHDLETIFTQTLKQQTPKQLELYWRERYIWLEMRIYPTRSGLAIYATDISERKHMELALTASNRELNQHVSELAALNTMMRTLTTATTVTQALQLAAPMVASLLNLDSVSIGLLEAEQAQNTLKHLDLNSSNLKHIDIQNATQPARASDPIDDTRTYLHELVRYSQGQVTCFGTNEGLWHLHKDRAALLAIRDNTPIHTPNVVTIDPAVVCSQQGNSASELETAASAVLDDSLQVVTKEAMPEVFTSSSSLSTPTKEEGIPTSSRQLDEPQGYNLLTLPLRVQHAPIGILRLALDRGRAFKDGEMELAQTVAGQIAGAVSNLRLLEVQQRITHDVQDANRQLEDTKAQLELKNKRLMTLSIRDALTGIYNRRHLETQLSKEFTRAVRYDIPLSVMLCDIDDFKQVNDTFSHSIGDDVLRRVATIMQQNTRDVDLVARYGGEEFVVVFPETSRNDALQACEKIRKLVEDHPWYELARGLQVTLSQGLSDDTSMDNHEELLSHADKLLYTAKGAGKNRIATVDLITSP